MSQIKKFFMNDNTVIVNLTSNNCLTGADILDSNGFKKIITKYLLSINENSNRSLQRIKSISKSADEIINFMKLLLVFKFEEVVSKNYKFQKYAPYRKEITEFIDTLYSFWLNLERYVIIQRRLVEMNDDNSIMIDTTDQFSKHVLSLYRFFLNKLLDKPIRINRQTPAGFSAGFIVTPEIYQFPPKYKFFKGINIVSGVVIRTPFIGHSSSNDRVGTFKEIKENPLNFLRMTKRHWFCFPIKVGGLLAFVFFHRTLMHHGVALCNTFEPGIEDYYKGKKPDLVYVYGGLKQEEDSTYYIDKENDFYLGYVARNEKNDYFGYMKDMILNLHNVYMINHRVLPVHGSMVNIVNKDNKETNIVVIGDNGAGKSEVFKSLKMLNDKRIVEMNVIFNDMGIFYQKDGNVFAKGTQTGAYMMLDYLEPGHAYEELDRAIFLNPESSVPKIMLPNTSYEFISKEHKIDYVFYVNNYESSNQAIKFFENIQEVLQVFKEKRVKFKTSITEPCMKSNYFHTPLESEQVRKESEQIMDELFQVMFEKKVRFGEVFSKVSGKAKEKETSYNAAKSILELL